MLRVQIPFQDRDIPKMPSNDIVPVKYMILCTEMEGAEPP